MSGGVIFGRQIQTLWGGCIFGGLPTWPNPPPRGGGTRGWDPPPDHETLKKIWPQCVACSAGGKPQKYKQRRRKPASVLQHSSLSLLLTRTIEHFPTLHHKIFGNPIKSFFLQCESDTCVSPKWFIAETQTQISPQTDVLGVPTKECTQRHGALGASGSSSGGTRPLTSTSRRVVSTSVPAGGRAGVWDLCAAICGVVVPHRSPRRGMNGVLCDKSSLT